jgi:hypothetical protein
MPLDTAASGFIPVRPSTNYLDPSLGLNIMQRYGMSSQDRAFAEGNLKSAYDTKRMSADMRAIDREDEAYLEKREFESSLGEFLVELSRVDETDPEFDTRLASLISDPRALENDAVMAVYKLKVGNRDRDRQASQAEQQYQERLKMDIVSQIGAERFPEVLGPDGKVDYMKVGALRFEVGQTQLQSDAAKAARVERMKTFNNDVVAVDLRSRAAGDELVKQRRDAFLKAAASQKVPLGLADTEGDLALTSHLDGAAIMGKETFLAGLVKIVPADNIPAHITDPGLQFAYALMNQAKLSAGTQQMLKAGEELWNAAAARRDLPEGKADEGAPLTPDEELSAEEILRRARGE